MSRIRPLRQATLLFLLIAGSAAAWADTPERNPPRDRTQTQDQKQKEDLPDSVRRVERETGGEVLRAEPMQRDGREVYRIKVLTADGRVRVMQDDPNARRDDRQRDGRNAGDRNGGDQNSDRGNSDRRNSDQGGSDRGNGNGNGSGKEKRPPKDRDGEPQQF